MNFQIGQTQLMIEVMGQQNDFRIRHRTGVTNHFDPKLVELAKTTSLRPFLSEHRTYVKEFRHWSLTVELMFNVSPDNWGCPFRTERDASAPFIRKGVHLFFHNISGGADPPLEELGVFKDG